MASSLHKDLTIACLGITTDAQSKDNKFRNLLKNLAVELALEACKKAVELKKTLPVISDESVFRTTNATDRIPSIASINLLLAKETAKNLGLQKIAKDFTELENGLDSIIISHKYRNIEKAITYLNNSLEAMNFTEHLRRRVSELEKRRKNLIKVENYRANAVRKTLISSMILSFRLNIVSEESIADGYKIKYNKNRAEQADLLSKKKEEEIQNKIDFYKNCIEKEFFCIENIKESYKIQCEGYKSRLNTLSETFDENDTRMTDELNFKNSKLTNLQEIRKTNQQKLQQYKIEIEQMMEKIKEIPVLSYPKIPLSESIFEIFTNTIILKIQHPK